MEKYITKSYLLGLIEKPITAREITLKIIEDFNIVKKSWNHNDTQKLFELANINLKNKPRKTKKYESKILNTSEISREIKRNRFSNN